LFLDKVFLQGALRFFLWPRLPESNETKRKPIKNGLTVMKTQSIIAAKERHNAVAREARSLARHAATFLMASHTGLVIVGACVTAMWLHIATGTDTLSTQLSVGRDALIALSWMAIRATIDTVTSLKQQKGEKL
jgi:hypothetical protein